MKNTNSEIIKSKIDLLVCELIVYSGFTSSIGLLNGRMGICILLYYYSRYFKSEEAEKHACFLIDSIYRDTNNNSLDFGTSLLWVAWGLNYLYKNGFVEADIDEVLKDLDITVCNRYSKNISLGIYITCRMQTSKYEDIWKEKGILWLENVEKLIVQQIKMNISDLSLLLYCFQKFQYYNISVNYLERLKNSLLSYNRFLGKVYISNTDMILLHSLIGQNDLFFIEPNVLNSSLKDINKFFLNRLIYDGVIINTPECYLKGISSIICENKCIDELIMLANPENIGLNNFLGGFTWTLLQYYNDSYLIKSH